MKVSARTFAAFAIAPVLVGVLLASCATREIPYEELEVSYGLPTSAYFEPEAGLRVHYSVEGPDGARDIILVHGFAASVHAWLPWAERLRDDFRLISVDLPGHGLTASPEGYRASLQGNAALIDELATEVGADRFVLVGNSMGGAVALTYALDHPERLDGLVLVNSAGWSGGDDETGEGPPVVFMLLNNPIGRAILKMFDPRMFATGGLEAAYLDEELVTDELIDRYAELALAPGHRDVLLTQNSSPLEPLTANRLSAITVPTLVMAGDQDRIIPVTASQEIAAAIPGAVLVTYPDGGHVPMEQLPDKSAADMRAFLESLPAHAGRSSDRAEP